MKKNSRIFVAGGTGLVGSAIVKNLLKNGYDNVIADRFDLRDTELVNSYFEVNGIEYVFLAAAKVGGILANKNYPADFIYDNLMIQSNIIEACRLFEVEKLLFLGSSCIYPKSCDQPIKEEYLLTGELEPTNRPYALAKIAGIEMCKSYKKQHNLNSICLMPTNLYGPNDNYDLETSHVLPAMIRKFHVAKILNQENVTLWGTGTPKREFLYSDDLADACVFLMNNYEDDEIINVGFGEDIEIKHLANTVSETIGYKGEIIWDQSKPDGTMRKVLDCNKLNNLNWKPKINLVEGIKLAYEDFLVKYGEVV